MKPMKRRLIIDALAFEYGKSFGYQEYLLNLIDYFYANRSKILYEEIIIVCVKSQQKYFLKYSDCLKIKGLNCHSIYIRLLMQTLMPLILSLKECDLVLYTANYSSLIKRSPHILVIHDLLFKRKSLFPYRLMRLQRLFYLPKSIKKADKIIAISNFTANDVTQYYPSCKKKIVSIYNYFNFTKFFSSQEIETENEYFISVCSNAVHKNTLVVLKAFKSYCMNGGKYDLVLVGALKDGSETNLYYEKLPDSIKLGIKIYDKITNSLLAGLYQNAKAYISASLFEGLGMPIVEAMYFNIPVILSDDIVFREVSLNKGFYFNPLKPEDLVDRMFYVQNHPKMKFNYQEEILDLYSEQNTSQRYVDLFNEFYNK